jgi:nucleoid-associated protein YgaU
MKLNLRATLGFAFLCAGISAFSLSYDDNQYQRKSRAYGNLAEKAFNEGNYEQAEAYALEAEKYARESAAFIEQMIARSEAEPTVQRARTRLAWAKGIHAERFFPQEWASASAALSRAEELFAQGSYPGAKIEAEQVLSALEAVKEIVPLPKYYTVDPWNPSRDCFWNIAKNPAVYGDPFLWEKLYKANKDSLKRPGNPNLLMPGMVVTIPSIRGEYREGMYDPSKKYEQLRK